MRHTDDNISCVSLNSQFYDCLQVKDKIAKIGLVCSQFKLVCACSSAG